MKRGSLGQLTTPRSRNRLEPGVAWAADNGCFNSKTYPGDYEWFGWLASLDPQDCLFAVAPDVVADADATLARSTPWLARIRDLGYPAAFVAQDGAEASSLPWDEMDALFIGGSTDWKLGDEARALAREAKERGKWVHMGRVNSRKRARIAAIDFGCDSVDGTYLAFGPDVNLPKLLGWLEELP